MTRGGATGDLLLLRRLMAEVRPLRSQVLVFVGINLLAVPLTLLAPVPLALVVDGVVRGDSVGGLPSVLLPSAIEGSTTALLLFATVLLVLVALFSEFQRLATTILGTRTGERLELDFRSRIFSHAQRLSLSYHDSRGTFNTVYRVLNDASSIQWVAIYGIAPLVTAVFTLAGMLIVTARVDLALAAIALSIAPVLALLARAYRTRLRDGWIDVKERDSRSLSVVHETLGALRVVRAFGQEEHESRRFSSLSEGRLQAHVRVVVLDGFLRLLIAMTTALGTAAVLYIGVRGVQAGRLSLGELLLVLGYLAQIYQPLQTMSQGVAALQASLASAERVFELLDEEPEIRQTRGARRIKRARGEVALEHVSFAYPRGPQVLHDLTLKAEPGTTVGIAGTTGAGKSTLINLLPRFHDPTSGRVLLDGRDVRDYRIDDLRRQFAVMLQEPVLFSVTIAENIAYGRPNSSRRDIQRAAEMANAHDVIDALPNGYETVLGERGASLSLGERQRISLARTFLRDAPVLILDEPTSSVDVRTEALIIEALQRLMANTTTFIIAHRLSTLDNCDVLLELEDGRLVNHTTDVNSALRRRIDATADLRTFVKSR